MLKPPVAMSMIDVFQLQRSYKNIFACNLFVLHNFIYTGSPRITLILVNQKYHAKRNRVNWG